LDVLDELLDWAEILDLLGLRHVGTDSVGDLWVREGSSSAYSVKAMHETPCVVNWSENLAPPVGVGLAKGEFLAYMTGYNGECGPMLRDLFVGVNPAGIPQAVVDAMASVGSVTVITLKHGERPSPEQFMSGARFQYEDEPATNSADSVEVITDQDLDDYLATFTGHAEPSALVRREMWARNDGPGRLPLHAARFVHESILGQYPAALAAAVVADICGLYGTDPKATLKTALATVLTPAVSD
jgi:hypothetical protein